MDGLPVGVRLSSVARRLGAHLLDVVFAVFTLFIGWAVWSLIVWGRGQTPGKQVLGMKTVRLADNRRAGWGWMALREVIVKPIISTLAVLTLYIILFWPLWDKKNQELWDKVLGTIVVDDEHDLLNPQKQDLLATR